jgi:hypothetical protein
LRIKVARERRFSVADAVNDRVGKSRLYALAPATRLRRQHNAERPGPTNLRPEASLYGAAPQTDLNA